MLTRLLEAKDREFIKQSSLVLLQENQFENRL